MNFETRERAQQPDVIAPDGSEVRILASTSRGSMAQFTLPPGAVSKAVAHRTVEEVWLVTHGTGRMWRRLGDAEVTVELRTVLCGTELHVVQTGIPEAIPVEMCYLGWQESLAQLAQLVEPEIPG